MTTPEWIKLFDNAFQCMGERLEQVLQLNSCREHWIQAEISLHAWFKDEVEIWTDFPIGGNRKADLYAEDGEGSISMVAEVKCLSDFSQAKCLEGDWSVRSDIDRLHSIQSPTRLFVLVIEKNEVETNIGRALRTEAWVGGKSPHELDLGFCLIRIWAI
ncbi:hypothetical protein [Pseudomonas sp. Q2-TVG4-2]|uniref:hypothetical protein n=1 Tax=Pseudomonas sp. Q2-TVG4-2 TaxID=1685699 RepID=UPI0015E78DAE|nr:hypothetical protein [Pseudomonas sp. Q2-TVG4-2]